MKDKRLRRRSLVRGTNGSEGIDWDEGPMTSKKILSCLLSRGNIDFEGVDHPHLGYSLSCLLFPCTEGASIPKVLKELNATRESPVPLNRRANGFEGDLWFEGSMAPKRLIGTKDQWFRRNPLALKVISVPNDPKGSMVPKKILRRHLGYSLLSLLLLLSRRILRS